MLHLLLVEDELPIRRRILNGINWAEFQIGEVRDAADGLSALEICDTFPPHILLTDIRMPYMDGIELASRVVKRFPHVKIIFLSGYSDKEYLKEAIRLSAVNYLEKPISLAELRSSLSAAAMRIQEEQATVQKVTQYEYGKMIAEYGELAALLCQSNAPDQEIERLPAAFQEATLYLSAAIKVVSFPVDEEFSGISKRMVSSIYDACRTGELAQFFPLCDLRHNHLVIHLAGMHASSHYNDYINVDRYFDQLTKRLMGLGIQITIGVGSLESSVDDIHKSYETAVLTLQQLFYQSNESTAFYKKNLSTVYAFHNRQQEDFSHVLKQEDSCHAIRFIRNLTEDIRRHTNTLVCNVLRFYFELFRILLEQASGEQVELLGERFPNEMALWQYMNGLNSIDELSDLLVSAIEQYYTTIQDTRYDNPVVSRAVQFIRKQFNNPDLCITMICQHCGLSTAYFCRVFRQVTGQTPNHYILEYRMGKAKTFLEDPLYKVKDIAEKVGYRDSNYFSYQFKKYAGLSPSEYRDLVL